MLYALFVIFHLSLPILGLIMLANHRTYLNNQRVLNDSLRAHQIIRVRYGKG
jgi:hypothetical protein